MAVDVVDFVPSLKRAVQPPGADLYVGVTDGVWSGYLTDAFWEARLDGFLRGWTVFQDDPAAPENAQFVPVSAGGPDIPRADVALVIIYAAVTVLRNRILNSNTKFRAKAGPVEFEQENSATVLAEMLKQLRTAKDRILEAMEMNSPTAVMLIDAYSTRLFDGGLSYYGGIELSG